MKGAMFAACIVVGSAIMTHSARSEPPNTARSWSFDSDKAGALPPGFSAAKGASGKVGRWTVKAEPGAPSGGQVLAQVDSDNSADRFLMAVAEAPVLRDVRVSVRCKATAGKTDQACGLVFRYRDANNYCVTRANALEGNVRLYTVQDGRRKQLASWEGKVTRNHWHELRAEARCDHLVVSWDGAKVIDAHESTCGEAGKVGVWTKADSVTSFDDLTVAAATTP